MSESEFLKGYIQAIRDVSSALQNLRLGKNIDNKIIPVIAELVQKRTTRPAKPKKPSIIITKLDENGMLCMDHEATQYYMEHPEDLQERLSQSEFNRGEF